jgi:predicted amidohydrolase YtcJ
MLAAYTIQGAFVQHQEELTGSIEVGKAADLVVLDRNLFTIPPAEISEARVLLTLLAGEAVWRDAALGRPGQEPGQGPGDPPSATH